MVHWGHVRFRVVIKCIKLLSLFSLAFPIMQGRRYDWWSFFSTSPCPSPRPLSVQYFSNFVDMGLSVWFSVVLSSFSLVYLPSTLSSVCVRHLSSSHACTISIFSRWSFWKPMCSFLILSLRVTPHIHRSILISVTSIRFSCLFIVASVLHRAGQPASGWQLSARTCNFVTSRPYWPATFCLELPCQQRCQSELELWLVTV